ncbi:unnamed protein product [Trichogramma brassicae]|uniref:Reverse transcriptase domain-containing protein n=1 Tax=Trichogramma brassicae TaxID=86971 RepID=A0A6H5IV27_9HYME|nr:unnamed protein product [Trichogramma brassicae]
MASSLMAVITGACDASISKANPRHRHEPVYWYTAEIAYLRRSCLRARRLLQKSRGRHDEKAYSANYASPRRLLQVVIKTSRAGLPCSCRVEQGSPSQPSPWRNSKKLSRGSRSNLCLARMAYLTQRSRSLLPHDPTSSCNPLTSRPCIIRCVCWTRRARFWRESYATGWKLSQREPGGLSERQYGFRKGRSTIDTIEDIISHFHRLECSSRHEVAPWHQEVLRHGDFRREECVQFGPCGTTSAPPYAVCSCPITR